MPRAGLPACLIPLLVSFAASQGPVELIKTGNVWVYARDQFDLFINQYESSFTGTVKYRIDRSRTVGDTLKFTVTQTDSGSFHQIGDPDSVGIRRNALSYFYVNDVLYDSATRQPAAGPFFSFYTYLTQLEYFKSKYGDDTLNFISSSNFTNSYAYLESYGTIESQYYFHGISTRQDNIILQSFNGKPFARDQLVILAPVAIRPREPANRARSLSAAFPFFATRDGRCDAKGRRIHFQSRPPLP